MADQNPKPSTSQTPTDSPSETKPADSDEQAEQNPAAEWGERIHTGKTIARGGKSTGHVPGATEAK